MAKMGQPTKYKPEYCEMLINHMRDCFSFESFAAVAKVHRDTLYEWVKLWPEFKEAKELAWSESLYSWEKVGIDGTRGKIRNYNNASYIFIMCNRFPDIYKNKHFVLDKEKDTSHADKLERAKKRKNEKDE